MVYVNLFGAFLWGYLHDYILFNHNNFDICKYCGWENEDRFDGGYGGSQGRSLRHSVRGKVKKAAETTQRQSKRKKPL